ncbi:Streptomyces sporulation and cell division protein, SsgA [Actinacidiphila yanglinensis]|uniref:Streptomyces sporulation and cell division protein, SsgA n=1 Tax=Actinacidiphila yanglinensis TaxID=310779 RepID=A0A1H6E3F1_9ACTN|nr:SsgA family sporulation/cell division regulator [Actinacidiphila yanglinensis]SEG92152.1 Streptomyces sporulation and cell division protein, SsgA [Actinacidiphila yanglinensis]
MSGNRHDEGRSRARAARLPSLSLNVQRVLESSSCRQTVRATFRYDPDTPLVVTVVFRVHSGQQVTWHLGRDLLYEGMYALSGIADVQVWPTEHDDERPTAWLKISSRTTAALFELPVPPLAEWLEDTYALVPPGQESTELDWDAFAAGLTADPDVSAG